MTNRSTSRFMTRALALAARGTGATHPNPMVGAVVVKDGEVVGEGWHKAPGEVHAEVMALDLAGQETRGADLYVNLEPCAHHGRTPPCTEAILDAGITRVFVSMKDPHGLVDGRGIEGLRDGGVEVVLGDGESRARELNRAFFHFAMTGDPYVTLKLALTLDGRIAASDGTSRWITGEKSRRSVHRIRASADAILTGAGTAVADDPRLTVRTGRKGRQPYRVVLDPTLRVPRESNLVRAAADGRTVVVAADGLPGKKYADLEKTGVRVVKLPAVDGLFSWPDLSGALVDLEILHLMVEGGSATAAWFLKAGAVKRLELYYAPKLLGGDGISSVGELGIGTISGAMSWSLQRCRRLGEDVHLTLDAREG